MSETPWRLLVDPPAAAAWNMAVDEAILESTLRQDGPPTLRLYSWHPAALSLGAHQAAAYDPGFLRQSGVHLVRRPTGGLAVLHENECTYSVCGRLRTQAFRGEVLDTYLRIAEALVKALSLLGLAAEIAGRRPPFSATADRRMAACFGVTSSHEIRVQGRKLIGSAQVRRRGAFLQHGSIPLVSDPERLARAIGGGVGEPSTDLSRLLGRQANGDVLTRALVAGFEQRFDTKLERARLTEAELEHATRLYSWKYLSAEWTLDAGPPGPAVSRPD